MRHFLQIDGHSTEDLYQILDTAESFTSVDGRAVKKVPLLTWQNNCKSIF